MNAQRSGRAAEARTRHREHRGLPVGRSAEAVGRGWPARARTGARLLGVAGLQQSVSMMLRQTARENAEVLGGLWTLPPYGQPLCA